MLTVLWNMNGVNDSVSAEGLLSKQRNILQIFEGECEVIHLAKRT